MLADTTKISGINKENDLEVATIEGTIRVDDHQRNVPLEKGVSIKLSNIISISVFQ